MSCNAHLVCFILVVFATAHHAAVTPATVFMGRVPTPVAGPTRNAPTSQQESWVINAAYKVMKSLSPTKKRKDEAADAGVTKQRKEGVLVGADAVVLEEVQQLLRENWNIKRGLKILRKQNEELETAEDAWKRGMDKIMTLEQQVRQAALPFVPAIPEVMVGC